MAANGAVEMSPQRSPARAELLILLHAQPSFALAAKCDKRPREYWGPYSPNNAAKPSTAQTSPRVRLIPVPLLPQQDFSAVSAAVTAAHRVKNIVGCDLLSSFMPT